jgi:hypothetical protein
MSTCGLLGCMEEARECVAQLRAIQPSGTVVWMSKVLKAALQRNRRAHEMWIEGARRRGCPRHGAIARLLRPGG